MVVFPICPPLTPMHQNPLQEVDIRSACTSRDRRPRRAAKLDAPLHMAAPNCWLVSSPPYRMVHLDFFAFGADGLGLSTALEAGVSLRMLRRGHATGTTLGTEGVNIPDSLIEDALKVSLRQGGALKILDGADLLGADQGLVIRHGLHTLGAQTLEGGRVLAKIELGADEDNGHVGSVVVNLGVPLNRDEYQQSMVMIRGVAAECVVN